MSRRQLVAPLAPLLMVTFHAGGAGAEEAKRTGEILSMMMEMDRMEIRAARLAERRAASDDVRQMARRIRRDHEFSIGMTLAFARNQGIELRGEGEEPGRLPGRRGRMMGEEWMGGMMREQLARKLRELESLRGEEFDRKFTQHMVQSHQRAIGILKNVRETAEANLRALIDKSIPILEQHLELAIAVAGRAEPRAKLEELGGPRLAI